MTSDSYIQIPWSVHKNCTYSRLFTSNNVHFVCESHVIVFDSWEVLHVWLDRVRFLFCFCFSRTPTKLSGWRVCVLCIELWQFVAWRLELHIKFFPRKLESFRRTLLLFVKICSLKNIFPQKNIWKFELFFISNKFWKELKWPFFQKRSKEWTADASQFCWNASKRIITQRHPKCYTAFQLYTVCKQNLDSFLYDYRLPLYLSSRRSFSGLFTSWWCLELFAAENGMFSLKVFFRMLSQSWLFNILRICFVWWLCVGFFQILIII